MAVTRYLDKEIINIPEKQTLEPRQSDPCKPALPVELKDLIHFTASSVPYDADYVVDKDTRATTNFANFARDCPGQGQNINSFLSLVNADLNKLLDQDGGCDRYAIKLEILSIRGHIQSPPSSDGILMTEVMRAAVQDRQSGQIHPGPTGLNFSSYLRDYDFRIVLPQLLRAQASPQEMEGFGKLHGALSRLQLGSQGVIPEPLAIAISISQNCTYVAAQGIHPILGREYKASEASLTDRYFAHMGLHPQFFRPHSFPAPIAFYSAESLSTQSSFYLASLVAVMGNFQRIYRPEIYLSNSGFSERPGDPSRASLTNPNYQPPLLTYDRQERELLSETQSRLIEERFIKPYAHLFNGCPLESAG